jgi:hypothetical protein
MFALIFTLLQFAPTLAADVTKAVQAVEAATGTPAKIKAAIAGLQTILTALQALATSLE